MFVLPQQTQRITPTSHICHQLHRRQLFIQSTWHQVSLHTPANALPDKLTTDAGKMNDLPRLGVESVNNGLSALASEFHPGSSPYLFPGSKSSFTTKKTTSRSGNDSFTDLMHMMRSKKPYAQAPILSTGM